MEEIHLELLLNKPVREPGGRVVGYIEEIHVRRVSADEWVVHEYIMGPAGWLERMSIAIGGLPRRLGLHVGTSYRIPWHELDLSDVRRPMLKKPVNQSCKRFEGPVPAEGWFKQGGVDVENS